MGRQVDDKTRLGQRASAASERLRRVANLLDHAGADVLGERLRALRAQQGMSVRALAERAGVSKNSVVRAEQGRGSHPHTVIRLCEALGTHAERLTAALPSSMVTVAVHHREHDQWHDLADYAGAPIRAPEAATVDLRARLASARNVPALIVMLRSVLPNGHGYAGVIELFHPTPIRRHPGEEFVYVLEGKAVVEICGKAHPLATGESIMFHSGESHRYLRAKGARGSVRILSVRMNVR